MKCAVAFAVLLAGCSVLLGDAPNASPPPKAASSTLLEDLVRMTRAGSSDTAVLAYARAHRAELPAEVSDASLRWLRASGVSLRVVRYMSAIDVRVSGSENPEGLGYAGEGEGSPRRAYSPWSERDTEAASEVRSDDDSGAVYGGLNAYAGEDSDYGFPYEPYFGYPYLSAPYLSFAFAGRSDFFRRFPHRDRPGHGDRRGHRFDGGHRDGWRNRGGARDAWRDRGSEGQRGRRGSSMAAGPRNPGRPAFAAGVAAGGRGRAPGARGFGNPGSAARGFSPGPRNSVGPGARARTGAGSGRGSIGTSRGGRGRR